MASTQRSYRNPLPAKSGNHRFLLQQIRASRFSEDVRELVVSMMRKSRSGEELWLAIEGLRVIVGRPNYTRRAGPTGRRKLRNGRVIEVKYGPCDRISRRTVQKRLAKALEEQAIQRTYPENSCVTCLGKGRARCSHAAGEYHDFRRSATYAPLVENWTPRETWEQWNVKRQAERKTATPIRTGKDISFTEALTGRAP